MLKELFILAQYVQTIVRVAVIVHHNLLQIVFQLVIKQEQLINRMGKLELVLQQYVQIDIDFSFDQIYKAVCEIDLK